MSIARNLFAQPLSGKTARAKTIDLEALLASLYRDHLSRHAAHPYILEHQQPKCIANQVRTFHWYRRYLPASGSLLDWGCYHGPDCCLLRAWYDQQYELHSCDFADPEQFRVFRDFSGSAYRQLTDCVALPYESASFDAVIATGVLEHTAMDYESLKELHRVLKRDGILIITYLPNWLSVREWIQRNIHKKDFHRRLYGIQDTRKLMKQSGFYPIVQRHHTFFWERLVETAGLAKWSEAAAAVMRKLAPIQVLSSTHCCIAQKVIVM
jgi:SAM-dependent methyltransferase